MQNKISQKLHLARKRLIARFIKEPSLPFMEPHTYAFDEYFRESFENSIIGPQLGFVQMPFTLVALGGYGRREQSYFSDIDLLLLYKDHVPDSAAELVREIVYPLWDIGLEVGYATRSVKECIKICKEDLEVFTSILDARFLCGFSQLYSDLVEDIQKKVVKPKAKKLMKALVARNQERHLKFGDSSYLLEPNLKEGKGGLRDYHTMLWIARLESKIKDTSELEAYGYLTHNEYEALSDALSFIWNIRSRFHHMTGRKSDQLHFEYQIALAESLKYKKIDQQEPVERFLGELHGCMDNIKQQHLMFLVELGLLKKPRLKRGFLYKTTLLEGLMIERDMLTFISATVLHKNPILLIRVFEESARLKIPLSAEGKRLVQEFGFLVDDEFRRSKEVKKIFEKILVKPALTFNVLNEMLNTGLLTQYIPEFDLLVNRIQYDEYHLYPVDKHLIRTVQVLKSFESSAGPESHGLYQDICREVARKRKLLILAALLHDIGKGDTGSNHSEKGAELVIPIMERMGYREDEIDTVAFLVRLHLFLVKTATRRDIHDEKTAIFCARQIRDVDRLKMLYLLTVADSMATGPKAWNDWTGALLQALFLKVLSVLKMGELASDEAVHIVEDKKKKLQAELETMGKTNLDSYLDVMAPRYLLYVSAEEIVEHLKLYERYHQTGFEWHLMRDEEADTRTITICTTNRPGLFSRISGVLTLNGIDILDVQVYTWRNNIALDIFTVRPPLDRVFEDQRWSKIEAHMKQALLGDVDIADLLQKKLAADTIKTPKLGPNPLKVHVDNQTSSFFTIVEVFADDFKGLLFLITDALFRCRLDVWVAKIATKVDQVVDVFYVTDFDGEKLEDHQQIEYVIQTIKKKITDTNDTTDNESVSNVKNNIPQY